MSTHFDLSHAVQKTCVFFCPDATKIQNDSQRSTSNFLWRKNSKTLNKKIIHILLSHSRRYEDVLFNFSRFLLKFRSTLILRWGGGEEGQKLKNFSLLNFFLNFNITFLATCGCASDFLNMLSKFKDGSSRVVVRTAAFHAGVQGLFSDLSSE